MGTIRYIGAIWCTTSRFHRNYLTFKSTTQAEAERKVQAELRTARLTLPDGGRWDRWTLYTPATAETPAKVVAWGDHLTIRWSSRYRAPVRGNDG